MPTPSRSTFRSSSGLALPVLATLTALVGGCSSGSSGLGTMGVTATTGATATSTGGSTTASTSTTGTPTSTGGATTGGTGGVTFHKDVEPILQQSCQKCHFAGGIAPFPLMTYADAVPQVALMVADTAQHIMPPWGAESTAECATRFPWKDDERLSDAQIKTISDWNQAGAPEGNPADAPPPKTPMPIGLANPSAELSPKAPYTLDATTDAFRCFVIDPGYTDATYVNGVNVVPGNNTIVHHVIVFTDPARKILSNTNVTIDANGSYDCFGGPQIGSGVLNPPGILAAWAPGGSPVDLPSDVAMTVPANALLVMQVHYHPHAGAKTDPDLTKVQLRYLSAAPAHKATAYLLGNFTGAATLSPPTSGILPSDADPASGPALLIPAGAKGHVETEQFYVPALLGQSKLYGIAAHMHYVGVDERVMIHRGTPPAGQPTDECLLQTPHWNFNWQRFYTYDTPLDTLPTAQGGDTFSIRCTYDNTLGNPKVAQALSEQGLNTPRDVSLGETTLDEMCLMGVLGIQ